MQLAGVMSQDVLSLTWHLTLQTVFSVAVQLVSQFVVAGDSLQVYEH
jgi:hypothetical protein